MGISLKNPLFLGYPILETSISFSFIKARPHRNASKNSAPTLGQAFLTLLAQIPEVFVQPEAHRIHGIYANRWGRWGILMVNVATYSVHGSYGKPLHGYGRFH